MNKCFLGAVLLCFVTHMQGMSEDTFRRIFINGTEKSSLMFQQLGSRSVNASIGRRWSLMYPLECALWNIRLKLKDGNGIITDDKWIELIEALLKAGAPTKYQDFNPLVCILYWYEKNPDIISKNFCERLIQLLMKYGAKPDDEAKDRHLIESINALETQRKSLPMSSLEQAILGNSPSFNNILSSIQPSNKLTSDNINQLKTLVQNHPLPSLGSPGAGGGPDGSAAPIAASLSAETTARSLIPRSLPYTQVGMVAIGSFVAGVICTRLYDWYIDQPDADDAKDLEKS